MITFTGNTVQTGDSVCFLKTVKVSGVYRKYKFIGVIKEITPDKISFTIKYTEPIKRLKHLLGKDTYLSMTKKDNIICKVDEQQLNSTLTPYMYRVETSSSYCPYEKIDGDTIYEGL